MSDTDAVMYLLDGVDPALRTSATAVIVLEKAPDRDKLLERFEVLTQNVPRMRTRVVKAPLSGAPPRFVEDPSFDLRYHVRFRGLPPGAGMAELLEMGAVTQMHDFDRARPLWWVIVVPELADGRAGMIFKFNHALADAAGGLMLLADLFDMTPEPDDPPRPGARAPVTAPPHLQRWWDAQLHEVRALGEVASGLGKLGVAAVRDPLGAPGKAVRSATSLIRTMSPGARQLSPLMTDRSLRIHFEALSRPIEALKAVARAHDVKLNDAFVAAVGGGFGSYHEHHEEPVRKLRMTMPVNIRTGDEHADGSGNHIVPVRILVPLDVGPAERMREVNRQSAQVRAEPGLDLFAPFATVATRLPTAPFGALYKKGVLDGTDFYTSNVFGPPMTLYIGGAPIQHFFAFGPMTGVPANVTCMSYGDSLEIALETDPAAVPDPALLARLMGESFDEVLALPAKKKKSKEKTKA